jgi:hypothetical protein
VSAQTFSCCILVIGSVACTGATAVRAGAGGRLVAGLRASPGEWAAAWAQQPSQRGSSSSASCFWLLKSRTSCNGICARDPQLARMLPLRGRPSLDCPVLGAGSQTCFHSSVQACWWCRTAACQWPMMDWLVDRVCRMHAVSCSNAACEMLACCLWCKRYIPGATRQHWPRASSPSTCPLS